MQNLLATTAIPTRPALVESDDDLVTTAEAAIILKCSASKLNKKRVHDSEDAIPYVKDGRSVRYRRRDLIAYRDARVRRSTSESSAPTAA